MMVHSIGDWVMLRFNLMDRMAGVQFGERRRITPQQLAKAAGLNRMTMSDLANQHASNRPDRRRGQTQRSFCLSSGSSAGAHLRAERAERYPMTFVSVNTDSLL